MAEKPHSTVLPLRVMRPFPPPLSTAGRFLIRHPRHGFMIGEILPFPDGTKICAIGIDTTPQRNPVVMALSPTNRDPDLEWCSLDISDNPGERVRALAREAKRRAEELSVAPEPTDDE